MKKRKVRLAVGQTVYISKSPIRVTAIENPEWFTGSDGKSYNINRVRRKKARG